MFQTALQSPEKPTKKGFFSDEVINEIRERIDIVQIIGEYVRLTPSGKNFKGLCPIHQEKTPSFYVLPEKQIFHCFGCGKGGNVFKFLMEVEKYSFPQTVTIFAQRCGVALSQGTDPEIEKRNKLFVILEKAAKLYSGQLYNASIGAKARAYLKNRGITPETARKFQIGFAPDNWNFLTQNLGTAPETMSLLQKSGLIKKRSSGEGFYDTFRNRLIIPILDSNGKFIGFGGRVLDPKDEPKYLNSPETEVFNKRKMLFNLRQAQTQIRRSNQAILVEGYLDVISLVQGGIENVVATLGTAITGEQVNLLSRNCENVFICYDADDAGQKATLRAIGLQKETPIQVKVITFEDEKDDPDSFIQREGPENFRKVIEKAKDIYTYLIESKTRGMKKTLGITAKEKMIAELKNFMPSIQSPVARSEILKNIASLLDVDPLALEKTLFANNPVVLSKRASQKPKDSGASLQQQEWIIKHLVDIPGDVEKVRNALSPEDFSDPQLKTLYVTICQQEEASGGTVKPAEILSSLNSPALESRLSELLISLENQPGQPFLECVQAIVKKRLETEARDVQKRISEAMTNGDNTETSRLLQKQTQILRKLEHLKGNSL